MQIIKTRMVHNLTTTHLTKDEVNRCILMLMVGSWCCEPVIETVNRFVRVYKVVRTTDDAIWGS